MKACKLCNQEVGKIRGLEAGMMEGMHVGPHAMQLPSFLAYQLLPIFLKIMDCPVKLLITQKFLVES